MCRQERGGTNLGGAEDQNGPARLDDRVTAASSLLDLVDLLESPLHGGSEVIIDVLAVLNEAALVAVATAGGSCKRGSDAKKKRRLT